MENESIAYILQKIMQEAVDAKPQSEPKEVWQDREWNKPKPIRERIYRNAC